MLESEQTLIPAFPRGPDAGVSGLETVSGAEGTDDNARRERGALSRRYSIRRRCGVSRVIPPETVHFA
jgi:hypothetical protein